MFKPAGDERMQVVIAFRSRFGSVRFLGRGWAGQAGRTLRVGARGDEWRKGGDGVSMELLGGVNGLGAGRRPLGEG